MEAVKKDRIFIYDFLRLVCMLFVLGVHVLNHLTEFAYAYNSTWWGIIILDNIFLICNPIFFMLSGKFALGKNYDDEKAYKSYYIKKIATLIIPFFIASVIIYMLLYHNSVADFLRKFWICDIDATYWFMYSLIGMIVFTPFYSKMLKNMKVFEKKLFLILGFIFNFLVVILKCFEINSAISFEALAIIGWHYYYFAGYLIEDVFETKKSQIGLIIFAIIAFIAQILIIRFSSISYRLTDPSPLFTIITFGFYISIVKFVTIKNEILKNLIKFVAKYSFVFYLFHHIIILQVVKLFDLNISSKMNAIFGICIYAICFIVTLLISVIYTRLIIEPIKNIAKKY